MHFDVAIVVRVDCAERGWLIESFSEHKFRSWRIPATHRFQRAIVISRYLIEARHAGSVAYPTDRFRRIEVIRRLLALSNDHHSYESLTVIIAAFYHPRHEVQRRILLPNRQLRSSQLEARSVIKLDIVNRLADETGIPKLKAEQAVDALFHSMKEALARGERIELRGFGVFIVKPRKRGVGRNPRTGQEVAIPTGKTIRFKPGKELHAHEGNGEEDSEA